MASMGPQGLLWDRDENGEVIATDFALNNPDGLAIGWAMMLYGFNALAEHGMVDRLRRYLTPDAKVGEAITKYWSEYDYDGAYRWPAAAKLTTEQANEADAYTADIATYISENYLSFIDGSKPLSEWDGYVETLRSIGMDEVIAIYQQLRRLSGSMTDLEASSFQGGPIIGVRCGSLCTFITARRAARRSVNDNNEEESKCPAKARSSKAPSRRITLTPLPGGRKRKRPRRRAERTVHTS
jgi:hypothetical protein